MTEVVSSIDREGRDVPHHIAMGTYVVIESDSAYARQCFIEYNCLPDQERHLRRALPSHAHDRAGARISVASAVLRKEPTGVPVCFNSDVVATAKRALKKGEMLDGEGGFLVWGKQMPADVSLAEGYLPLGLASDVKLKSDIAEGQPLDGRTWPSIRPPTPSKCGARWKRRLPGSLPLPSSRGEGKHISGGEAWQSRRRLRGWR